MSDFWYRVSKVVDTFGQQIESVARLMSFDREVLEIAIARINGLNDQLKGREKIADLQLYAQRTLILLNNIRTNDSLRHRHETIFNQALVLLVSYFGSTMHDLFCQGVGESLVKDKDAESSLLKEQVRFTLRDLRDADFDLRDRAPDLLVQSKDISFQDMQSIGRAFKDYVGISLTRTELVNDIILALSCRHVIVHTGAIADARFLRQIADAHPRRIKPDLSLNGRIQFSDDEVTEVARCMTSYVEAVTAAMFQKFGVDPALWNKQDLLEDNTS